MDKGELLSQAESSVLTVGYQFSQDQFDKILQLNELGKPNFIASDGEVIEDYRHPRTNVVIKAKKSWFL